MKIRSLFKKKARTFTDSRDGKTYKTINIGSQVWIAENLIYKPESGDFWMYDDLQSNADIYGYLYDWETAKKVCPIGWHLPSKAEFETLIKNCGGEGRNVYLSLKEDGKSGFNALNGGDRSGDGSYYGIGSYGEFWTSTEGNSGCAWFVYVGLFGETAEMNEFDIRSCYSVRCVKD